MESTGIVKRMFDAMTASTEKPLAETKGPAGRLASMVMGLFKSTTIELKGLDARIAALEATCDLLREKRSPTFRGTYQRGAVYSAGDWVVHGGSTWACMHATNAAPGQGEDAWMIAAARGRQSRGKGDDE